ncbi:hypothetical protein INF35_08235 [Subdoligranulum sp. DSM 109015]|uniref:Uncharacterized protein n=1 Tax=Gemmiger gallinarum TaxID=2779354 RepID=A0ABR9R3Q7_9FIRM|nr:hypothetical protein [Gemmiger gallinarum]MBE5037771.1 hypothetical protein [Gemmiger gallinarum]
METVRQKGRTQGEEGNKILPVWGRFRGKNPKDDVKTGGYAVSVEQNCAI